MEGGERNKELSGRGVDIAPDWTELAVDEDGSAFGGVEGTKGTLSPAPAAGMSANNGGNVELLISFFSSCRLEEVVTFSIAVEARDEDA